MQVVGIKSKLFESARGQVGVCTGMTGLGAGSHDRASHDNKVLIGSGIEDAYGFS